MTVNTNYYNQLFSSLNTYSSNSANSANSTSSIYNLLNTGNSLTSLLNTSKSSESKTALSETGARFATNAKSSATDLSAVMSGILGTNKSNVSSFNKKTVVSSDNDVLSVKSVNSKQNDYSDTSVKVSQVASKQVNTGTSLSAEALATNSGMNSGTQKMKLEIGNKSYNVDFVVSSKDTNRDVQQKLANAINSTNSGVKASVIYDEKTKKSELNIESISTGTDKEGELKFKITNNQGSAFNALGVSNVTQNAQNAVYSVNGGESKTSKSNDVDLGNGITATLKKASDEAVTFTTGTNMEDALSDVKKMVSSYNSLMESAIDNIDDRKTSALVQNIYGLTMSYSNSLNKIGISQTADGYLQIDEDKLNAASEDGSLQKFFESAGKGASYGFANRLARVADDVSKNTDRYVTKIQNSTDQNFLNAYYSSLSNTSLLFDYFA